MDYHVLGTLVVYRQGEELELGPFRQRALLALLLTEPNSVLSTDSIIDALWGTEGTTDRQNSLWVYVSGLRKALEPDREKRTDAQVLVTRSPGYALVTEPDEIDSVRFERMIGEGRALAPTDPAAASMVFGEALGLWSGKAFEDFAYESFAQTEIGRLEALREEAVEARVDSDLERGMATELLSELSTLVRQHPLNERLAGQYMLALYRSGRQAEALRAYQAVNGRLGDELGIEPSAPLRRLEEQIVLGTVEGPTHATATLGVPSTGVGVRGYELREEVSADEIGTTFRAYQSAVGREVAITIVREELANDPDFVRRFESEAQLVARVEHPHIVPLFDYWREPDAAYVVTPLVSGERLSEVLRGGALTTDGAAKLLDQIGSALHAAHRGGVTHRAVSADRVRIDAAGNAYLGGFSIGVDDATTIGGGQVSLVASTRTDLRDLALLMAHTLTGLDGEIEQIRGALEPAIMRVIDRAATGEVDGDGYDSVGTFIAALREVLVSDVTEGQNADATDAEDRTELLQDAVDNPYMGLRSFDASDATVFFGRERLVERLIARLGSTGTKGRFIAIVGPSGSGKSSVAKAGLLPALRQGALAGSESWFTVTMIPGSHPFEELESALRSIAISPPASLLDELLSDRGIERAISTIIPDDGSQVVLVIDQFEELFTLSDVESTQTFLDALSAAVANPHGRLRVVVTLRADFYDRPLQHLQVGELLREGTEVITPMTPEELERAITGPADPLGVTFEQGLVAELIRDVADRAGALPLLQYTLTELFESRRGQLIAHDSYRQLGGVSGALIERAEGLFAQLGDHAHDAVRQIFLRLVTFGEGAEDTRRRVLRSELEQLHIDQQILDGVLDTFGRHRLLSFDRDPVTRGPTVEISHEALLREWLRLRNWIDGARHDVRSQRRIAGALAEWESRQRQDDYLLAGGLLEELIAWSAGTAVTLTQSEQEFLDRSLAQREQAANLEAERELRAREAERVAANRLRLLSGAAVTTLAVAALAIFGIVQWRSASTARDEATAARDEATAARDENDSLITMAEYITASEMAFATDPEKAMLYAAEAVKATASLGYATEESVDWLQFSLQRLGVQFDAGPETPVAVRSGPDGLTGVFVLSPAELVAHADRATLFELTDAECVEVAGAPCDDADVPDDLPLRFGDKQYANSSPQAFDPTDPWPRPPLEGTRVVFSSEGSRGPLQAEFDRFTQETGIAVELVENGNVGGFDVAPFVDGAGLANVPDISRRWTPTIPEWAGERVLDLGEFLDEDQIRGDFGDYIIDLTTIGSGDDAEIQALPVSVIPNGLVYYAKPAFDQGGYEIPETWDELVELSRQVLDDGLAPWCFGWEDGLASGWPGTSLLESLVIRNSGTAVYDRWVAGDVAFDSPEILEAAKRAEELLFEPGFAFGGVEGVSSHWALTVGDWLLDRDPTRLNSRPAASPEGPLCMFIHQDSGMMNRFGDSTDSPSVAGELGVDVGVFMLPPIEGGGVTGTGTFAFGSTDRPEVRALMAYMASPAWGNQWAARVGFWEEPFFSLNSRFDTNWYRDNNNDSVRDFGDAQVRIDVHTATQAAAGAGTFRWDAWAQMPFDFSRWNENSERGPVLQGMIDWVDQKQPIEQILADIEAVRPRPS